MTSTEVESVLSAVQPLVFETGAEEVQYATAGTIFLVAYMGDWYVCTTRHGLHAEAPPAICVFPNDLSRKIFTLGHVFFVSRQDEPEDFVDLAIIDIDPVCRADEELAATTPLDLSLLSVADWKNTISGKILLVAGYPKELSTIEHEGQLLRTDRVVLHGNYEGPSKLDHLHLMRVTDGHSLASFSGLSGGPVLAVPADPNEDSSPILCGMAIRGTAESSLVHFLPAEVLIHAIKVKRIHDGRDDA
jgi:hypothetical protein